MRSFLSIILIPYLLAGCSIVNTPNINSDNNLDEDMAIKPKYTEKESPKYLSDAIKKLEDEAKSGDVEAQYRLAGAYEKGIGLPKDEKKSFYWYKKAADAGHALSQAYIGFLYSIGKGVPQNFEEAVKWYKLAASNGSVIAVYNMGIAYENGIGVNKNPIEAIKWYKKAAELGNNEAQCSPSSTKDLTAEKKETKEKNR